MNYKVKWNVGIVNKYGELIDFVVIDGEVNGIIKIGTNLKNVPIKDLEIIIEEKK